MEDCRFLLKLFLLESFLLGFEAAVTDEDFVVSSFFFFFYIYMKYLQVTNLLQLKYNKNTIIKTFYNTIPNIHLRHIR